MGMDSPQLASLEPEKVDPTVENDLNVLQGVWSPQEAVVVDEPEATTSTLPAPAEVRFLSETSDKNIRITLINGRKQFTCQVGYDDLMIFGVSSVPPFLRHLMVDCPSG